MNILVLVISLLVPLVASAQNIQGMNEADMQKMMQQMQQVQICMQNIDQSRLQVLEQRSQQMESEIRALCAEGRRDEAEQRAISFGREVSQDPDIQAMRACGEQMQGLLPELPFSEPENSASRHVCD